MGKPTIRFKGYTDDWEQRKLGELGTVQTCKRIFKEQTSEQGDIPFFKNGTIGLEPDSYISREVYEEFRRLYPYPEVGDTLISVVGSIGRTAEYAGKDEYFQDSNVVWLKTDGSINKKFLKISYQVIKWLIEGSTVKHLYNNNILRSEIVMPVSQIEQAKIAEFFEALDHLITLHQCKCDQAKILKKYMLQKMFPQNDEKVPKIRFKSFTDDWELRKVTELLKNSSSAMKIGPFGSALKKEYFVEEGIKVYAQENAFTGDFSMGDYYITEDKYKELKSCELYPGDLVISMMGTIGACAIFPKNAEKGIMNSHLLRLQFNNEVIPEYIMYLLRDSVLIRKQIDRLSVGSIMSGLSSSVVKKLVFPISKLAEQKRIVEYLDSIDHLITLHQHKCEELKNIKKFMLQNMFVQEK